MKIEQLFNDLVSTLIGRNRPVSAEAPKASSELPKASSELPEDLVTYDDQAEKMTRFLRPSQYSNKPSFQGASDDILRLILRKSLEHNVNPDFAGAVARQESSFRPNVISPDGGYGLFQLTPSRGRIGIGNPAYDKYTDEELLEPEFNTELGLKYLRQMLDIAQKDVDTGVVKPEWLYRDAYSRYNSGNINTTPAKRMKVNKVMDYMGKPEWKR